jgi:hypothetical protein
VDYYVRTSGKDKHNGKSADQAFRTLEKARQAMVAGDTTYVGAGVYEETVKPRKAGTAASTIRYIADVNGDHTGDGGEVAIVPKKGKWAVVLRNASYTQFHGFTFRSPNNGYSKGFSARKCVGLKLVGCRFDSVTYGANLIKAETEIRHCVFDNIPEYAITSSDRNLVITNSQIANCNYSVFHSAPSEGTERYLVEIANTLITGNVYGPHAHYSDLILDSNEITGNASYGAISAYGDITFKGTQRGITENGSGLYVIGNGTQPARTLRDLDFSGNVDYALMAMDCDLVLEDCKLQDTTGWGLYLQNATLHLQDTPICNNGHGIFVLTENREDEVRQTTLANVQIANCAGYGVYFSAFKKGSRPMPTLTLRQCVIENYGDTGLYSTNGSVEISDTVFRGNRSNSKVGITAYSSPQIHMDRVVVLGHNNWGICGYGNKMQLRNCIVSNNLQGLLLENANGKTQKATVWNCTFGNNDQRGLLQNSGQSVLVNNIFSSTADGIAALARSGGTMNHSYNLFYGYAETTVGTTAVDSEVVGDPGFVNGLAGDYTLQGSSAAINRGADMVGLVDYDFLNVARPQFGKWEIGAYEYPKDDGGVHIVEWNEIK